MPIPLYSTLDAVVTLRMMRQLALAVSRDEGEGVSRQWEVKTYMYTRIVVDRRSNP